MKTIKFKIRNLLLLLIILLLNKSIYTQNLVPNSSFESNSGCPTAFTSAGENIPKLDNWKNISVGSSNYSSTDYYSSECLTNYLTDVNDGNACRGPFSYPPGNTGHTGNRFVGSYFRNMCPPNNNNDYREGITVKLNNALIQGTHYKVEFYVCAGFDRSIDRIGVYFSKNKLTTSATGVIPQVETLPGQYFTKAQGWVKISLDYTPVESGQEYILITNFHTDVQTNSIGNQNYSAYYFIDDISVKLSCCAALKIYQNDGLLPTTTSVDYAILAGKNVLATNPGDVRVTSGQNVTFKAGNFINLQSGFRVESGGVFKTSIESCDENIQNDITVFIPNAYSRNCSSANPGYVIFPVAGVEAYKFLLYNRWGQLVYQSEGPVYSSIASIWDGYCYPNGIQSNCLVDDHVYILYTYNCYMNKTYQGTISMLGYQNCLTSGGNSTSTSRITSPNQEKPLFKNDLNYTVYPNPTNSDSKIQFQIDENNQTVSSNLYDMQGRLIKNILNSTVYNVGTYVVDIKRDNLPNGEYILEIKINNIYHSDKVIFN